MKANGETNSKKWLGYSTAKGRIYCFVCKLFPNHASSSALDFDAFDDGTTLILSQLMKTQKNRNSMLTYLARKQGYTLTSKLEEKIKAEQKYWWHVMEKM